MHDELDKAEKQIIEFESILQKVGNNSIEV